MNNSLPRYFRRSLLAVALTAAVGSAVHAAEQPSQNVQQGDTSFYLGERIEVAGKNLIDASKALTSVDRMAGDLAQSANIDYAWQLVGQLPGVTLTEFNQGTSSGKLSFRGFNGEGEVNAVKLLIDGIPANSNDGNMPYIDAVLPLEIATLEVVRGTTDPRYGLHNIAGNVAFITRSGGNYLDSRVSAGSFDKYDVQAAAGVEHGDFSQNYAVGYRTGKGYRQHADFSRTTLSGKWAWSPTELLTLGASARVYRADADEPGYLTQDVAYTSPRSTNAYNETDESSRDINQYSLSLDAQLSAASSLRLLSWLNQLQDNRYVTFSANTSQQNRYTDEKHYGVLAVYTYVPKVSFAQHLALEFGSSVERQDNISQRFLTVAQVPGRQTRDQQFDLTVAGAYVQTMIEPVSWLRITPAWRVDKVSGDFTDHLLTTQAKANDYGNISQPKLSVAVLPADNWTLFANWGRTFQIGVGSGSYLIPPRQLDLAPSINKGWELGAKYQPNAGFNVRAALWNQTATGEFKRKLNDPLGDFDNIGATERQGIDLQLSWQLLSRLSIWGAMAWQSADITTPDPQTPQLKGKDISHVPQWLHSAGFDLALTEKWSLGGQLRAQGKYHINTANDAGRYGDFVLVNVTARYALNAQTELSLEAKNLTDNYYEYVWWDGSQSLHSPGEGRSFTAAMHVRF